MVNYNNNYQNQENKKEIANNRIRYQHQYKIKINNYKIYKWR
jgi:hypothetical protein